MASGESGTRPRRRAAYEVHTQVAEFLFDVLKDETVLGRGDSGNGFFILIAIEPARVAAESTERIRRFLKLLANLFDTKRVRIDTSVGNVARLMPAPGTWKRKGENTLDRPPLRRSIRRSHAHPKSCQLAL
jgi:hypothetical protein